MGEAYTQTINVADDLDEVGRLAEELSALWESRGLPPDLEPTVNLALEEVLSNVLRHGKAGGSAEIQVTFRIADGAFEFTVSDSADAYDPLARPDPDIHLPLEQRRAGGLGVFMVKKLADEVDYQRRDGRNHLRFLKRLG